MRFLVLLLFLFSVSQAQYLIIKNQTVDVNQIKKIFFSGTTMTVQGTQNIVSDIYTVGTIKVTELPTGVTSKVSLNLMRQPLNYSTFDVRGRIINFNFSSSCIVVNKNKKITFSKN